MLHDCNAGSSVVDREQAVDVSRWRKAERERLIARRLNMSAHDRSSQTQAIARTLHEIIIPAPTTIVSVYWPIRGEPDLRSWMSEISGRGVRVALPIALAIGQPLQFREWLPSARLVRGLWKIPYPADGEEVLPTIVIAPVVGFDSAGYRLGYGGGFFDRTLAALTPETTAIGVGFADAALATIYPQPYDIPMHRIVTGIQSIRT